MLMMPVLKRGCIKLGYVYAERLSLCCCFPIVRNGFANVELPVC